MINIIFVSLVLTLVNEASGSLFSAGLISDREFILIYPPIENCKLFLYLFSLEKELVDVILSSTGSSSPLLNHILIKNGELTKFEVPYLYRAKIESTVQPSMSLKSTKSYSMNVLVRDVQGCDTYLALPVSRFGQKYYVFTLRYTPYFAVVTAAQSAEIDISLVNEHPSLFQTTVNNVLLKHGINVKVTIKNSEALYVLNCSLSSEVGSLTGTKVESVAHIGVIAGNCLSVFQATDCDAQSTSADPIAEMMLPVDTYGKEFVCFTIGGRTTKNSIEVFAPIHGTKIQYYQNENAKIFVTIAEPFQMVVTKNTHITADNPIAVYYVMPSKCPTIQEIGDPAVGVLTPVELYYHMYIFSSMDDINISEDYAVFIVNPKDRDYLHLNGQLVSPEWSHVLGEEFCVGLVRLDRGLQRAESTTFSRFGLMLYGLMPNASFMQPAGLIVAVIHQENCQKTMSTMVANDFIDNDCDGRIEEEFINFYDDDGDQQLDEDVHYLRDLEFHCPIRRFTANCTSQCQYCKSDCNKTTGVCDRHGCLEGSTQPECEDDLDYVEESGDKKPGNPNCSVGSHGDQCQFTCANCLPDCNKLTGECTECLPGFVLLFKTCDIDCPDFTYGKNCSQDCIKKCQGLDCTDRVDGNCSFPEDGTLNSSFPELTIEEETSSTFGLVFSVLAILPPTLVCIFFLLKRRTPEEFPQTIISEL